MSNVQAEAQSIIEDTISRYVDYLGSDNPDKGAFDSSTHVNQIMHLIKKCSIQERIDEHAYVDWLPNEEEWMFGDAERIAELNALKDGGQNA